MTLSNSNVQPAEPVVIVGGGFAGLFTALHLSHLDNADAVTLIDESDRFVFKPLLYELLTGEMNANQVCPTYIELLKNSAVRFVEAKATNVDLSEQVVETALGDRYPYEHLVLTLGSTTGYFGIEGAEEHALPFRTDKDAIHLSKHLRTCLQQAIQTSDEAERRALLTFIVVGAGPAGVEMAGTLGDLLPIRHERMGGDPQELRIVLMNRGQDILSGDINEQLRQDAQKALRNRTVPVEFVLGASVSRVQPKSIRYQKDDQTQTLEAATAIWTAGTSTHPLLNTLNLPDTHRDRRGRPKVTNSLQLLDYPNVFVGGDCAAEQDSLPPTAQVAYQEGRAIAYGLIRLTHGQSPHPVDVRVRGSLMKLGIRESAANLFGQFELTGKLGHVIRQARYLELLPTPVHDFKATTDWLTDEIFHRYTDPTDRQRSIASSTIWKWIGSVAAVCAVIGGLLLLL